MDSIRTYLWAFGRSYTYDPRRNSYLWFGVLWGLPVPLFSIFIDLHLTGDLFQPPLEAVRRHPIHYFFLAHPLLFGVVFGAMGTLRHDLELKVADLIRSLTDLATTDPLTGLYNRRYILEEMKKALLRSRRSGQPFTLLLFDLNAFKAVNDTRGHTEGDFVLQRTAGALRSAVREGDVLARYGGDEFLLLVHDDLPAARTLADRAAAAVMERAGLSFEVGAARFPEDGATVEDLINTADRHLGGDKKRRHETTTSR